MMLPPKNEKKQKAKIADEPQKAEDKKNEEAEATEGAVVRAMIVLWSLMQYMYLYHTLSDV
eukprot:15041450-Ditylum_brightwellii.AAC.1